MHRQTLLQLAQQGHIGVRAIGIGKRVSQPGWRVAPHTPMQGGVECADHGGNQDNLIFRHKATRFGCCPAECIIADLQYFYKGLTYP
jgi:hypothetical protein